MDEKLEGEMCYVCGIMRLMALGFMKMWIWNRFLIRNLLTEHPEEGLGPGQVA